MARIKMNLMYASVLRAPTTTGKVTDDNLTCEIRSHEFLLIILFPELSNEMVDFANAEAGQPRKSIHKCIYELLAFSYHCL